MHLKYFIGVFLCLILLACNEHNPYKNNSGIDPRLVAQIDTAHYTLIKWKDSIVDFGSLHSADSIPVKFGFQNVGNTPLFILKARASCWCLELNFPKDPIMPGRSAYIFATIKNKAYRGYFRKTIAITTNTKLKQNYRLILQGRILN